MIFANLFETPGQWHELPTDLMMDLEQLNYAKKAALLEWLQMQADQFVAQCRVQKVKKQALDDLSSAELDAWHAAAKAGQRATCRKRDTADDGH